MEDLWIFAEIKCKWIMFIVMYINNKKRRMTSIKIC